MAETRATCLVVDHIYAFVAVIGFSYYKLQPMSLGDYDGVAMN